MDVVALLTTMSAFGVQLRTVVAALAAVAGALFVLSAARTMVAAGHQSNYQPVKWGAIFTKIVVGGCLLQIAKIITDLRIGLLAGAGSEVRSMMTYGGATTGGSGVWQLLISTALIWVATIGVFAVFRGLLLAHKAGSGEAQGSSGDYFWQAFWHFLGGGIAINIGTTFS